MSDALIDVHWTKYSLMFTEASTHWCPLNQVLIDILTNAGKNWTCARCLYNSHVLVLSFVVGFICFCTDSLIRNGNVGKKYSTSQSKNNFKWRVFEYEYVARMLIFACTYSRSSNMVSGEPKISTSLPSFTQGLPKEFMVIQHDTVILQIV